jgi:glutamine amidotransferase
MPSSPLDVVVVRTGTANLASVVAALSRAGATARLTEDPAEVTAAERVVLPGVGAFAAAMDHLRAHGLASPLVERVRSGRPLLAICLGMQLLAEASDESPGVPGLAAFPGHATRLGPGVRVPQLGWNLVETGPSCRYMESGYAYFANSFCLTEVPEGWSVATADHGGPFVAGIERDRVLACQFHPELSGGWGLALLGRWLGQEASC